VQGPADTVPPRTRRSYDLGGYAISYDVSATVNSSQGVICERAMYGRTRRHALRDRPRDRH